MWVSDTPFGAQVSDLGGQRQPLHSLDCRKCSRRYHEESNRFRIRRTSPRGAQLYYGAKPLSSAMIHSRSTSQRSQRSLRLLSRTRCTGSVRALRKNKMPLQMTIAYCRALVRSNCVLIDLIDLNVPQLMSFASLCLLTPVCPVQLRRE